MGNLLDKLKINHRPRSGALDLLKYIGPGLLVTVGFIDPGNWATNLAAGSEFGYALLWVVTFSSVMLIIIQHNVAHLQSLPAALRESPHLALGYGSQHFHFAGRNLGRSDCAPDAVRNAYQGGGGDCYGRLHRDVADKYV